MTIFSNWQPKTIADKFVKGIVVGFIYGTVVPLGLVVALDNWVADQKASLTSPRHPPAELP